MFTNIKMFGVGKMKNEKWKNIYTNFEQYVLWVSSQRSDKEYMFIKLIKEHECYLEFI